MFLVFHMDTLKFENVDLIINEETVNMAKLFSNRL